MTIRTVGLALLLCPSLPALSQNAVPFSGAETAGLANTSSCSRNEWSLLNNVAGLASQDRLSVAVGYDFNYDLPAGARVGAVGNVPLPFGTMGVGMYRFGDNVYNEQSIHIGLANEFGIASLGVRLSYLQYQALGFGSAGLFTIGFGGIASLTSKLDVGAHIFHINQPAIAREEPEKLPTTMAVGISYALSDMAFLCAEIEKDIDYKPVYKLSLSYNPVKKTYFRTGFSLQPEVAFFGVGFSPASVTFDYAIQYSPLLGVNHQISFAYRIKRP